MKDKPKEKPKGWFSRAHETSEAHREAVAKYQQKAKPKARIERAKRRKLREKENYGLSGS